jgi:hypothetical protein
MPRPSLPSIVAAKRRVRRQRPAAAPAAPTLVSAVCDESPSLTLAFDRAVDVAGIDVALFRVDIGVMGFSSVGYDAAIVVNPTTVQILLSGIGEYAGPGVILTAAAGNGIVAADGGLAWAGVSGLGLPFP